MLIVVLGSPNDANGNLLPFALSRCEQAFKCYQNSEPSTSLIICTGGYGEHFNTTNTPHGEYLQKHLIKLGIPKNKFLDVVESRFTFEDASLCLDYFENYPDEKIYIVTSDFHIERTKLIFTGLYPDHTFIFISAISDIDDETRSDLLNHERNALDREKQNITAFNSKFVKQT